ncbi:non-classical arabinogalactan protein 31-like [Papaver somniferum]|uniref:non-classical arabinogalactan protein 31-like n=1 Tax=Papaver somniferum TaxID=3469 RepID=UPI000E7034C1|nr:non-classical arabinogalactan protein 31-like [Papaver somniferum]
MALCKVLVALVILVSLSSTVSSHSVPKPPVYVAPASPPVYSPAPSPIYSPAPSPVYAPVPSPVAAPPTPVASPPKYVIEKKFIAVQGVVYCKSCKYTAYNTLMEATALPGATVKMVCLTSAKKKNKPVVLTAVTDKKGYFFIPPSKKVSHLGAQKRCKVFLVSPPKKSKSMTPTNMYGGLSGAYLRPTKPSKPLPYALFTVGPFAYAPPPCKKSTTLY